HGPAHCRQDRRWLHPQHGHRHVGAWHARGVPRQAAAGGCRLPHRDGEAARLWPDGDRTHCLDRARGDRRRPPPGGAVMNAAQLKRLAALKLPAEAYYEVLDIIADLQSADEERRRLQRARQSRHRHRDSHVTVTSMSRHNMRDSDVTSSPPDPLKEERKKEEHVSSQSSDTCMRKKKDRATPLPDNWTPNDEDVAYARTMGWSDAKLTLEANRFRDHALAKGRVQKNWHAAWRNWTTSPYQGAGNGALAGSSKHRPTLGEVAGELHARAKALEGEAGFGEPDMFAFKGHRDG